MHRFLSVGVVCCSLNIVAQPPDCINFQNHVLDLPLFELQVRNNYGLDSFQKAATVSPSASNPLSLPFPKTASFPRYCYDFLGNHHRASWISTTLSDSRAYHAPDTFGFWKRAGRSPSTRIRCRGKGSVREYPHPTCATHSLACREDRNIRRYSPPGNITNT